MSDESFIREVDEAVRQEQLKVLWNKYGFLFVGGAVAIVAGVGGYKYWTFWTAERASNAGASFIGAVTLLEDGRNAEAIEVFKSLADEGPSGYRELARFRLASVYAKDGKLDEAVKIYDALASDSGIDKVQKGFAVIQAATLRLDDAPFEEMNKRLEALAVTGNYWRHSARELLGLSAFRAGKMTVAERYFNVMLSDQQSPANMRRRAEMMLSLLVQSAGPAAGAGN